MSFAKIVEMLLSLPYKFFPRRLSLVLALASAGLLILAFPDFEYWFLAWFALVPVMWAVEREKESVVKSFVVGFCFGTAFFFGTCWWLAYAPIHYAGFWPLLAYSLVFMACLGAGVFPGIFTAVISLLFRRFGSWGLLAAPFVWVVSEFARYWLTGNDWNAIGYSQAFCSGWTNFLLWTAEYGGVLLSGGVIVLFNVVITLILVRLGVAHRSAGRKLEVVCFVSALLFVLCGLSLNGYLISSRQLSKDSSMQTVVAIQPNVPMSGLNYLQLERYRSRQFEMAQSEIDDIPPSVRQRPALVVLPESPMNFMYNDDREFQQFVREFTTRNNISVLFNSAEPDRANGKYFNSAVMVGPDGNEIAEYDKIYLLPFGEAVPVPLDSIVPGFVGNFSYGREYDLLPVGDAKAGVMICFESHFGQLGRRYVQDGADLIIEMTNDGYLGPTPVLRQHLANAVFRAVETNRPVLRVTNVGITAYINERGQVLDVASSYQEATRVWSVAKSDGSQTFFVKFGDWFAWLCTVVTIALLVMGFRRKSAKTTNMRA